MRSYKRECVRTERETLMWKEMRNSYLLSSVVMIVLGVLLFLFPDTSVRMVCIGIGIVLLVYGLLKLLGLIQYREHFQVIGFQVVLSALPALIGVAMILAPEVFASILPVIVGVFLGIIGAVELHAALSMKKMAFEDWKSSMAVAVMTLVLAVLVLWNPFATVAATVMMIGAVLVISGASNLIQAARVRRKLHRLGKELEKSGTDWNSWFWF